MDVGQVADNSLTSKNGSIWTINGEDGGIGRCNTADRKLKEFSSTLILTSIIFVKDSAFFEVSIYPTCKAPTMEKVSMHLDGEVLNSDSISI